MKPLVTPDAIESIARSIQGCRRYALQPFKENVILHPEFFDGVAAMNALANHIEFETAEALAGTIQESFGGTKQQIPLEYKRRSAEYWPERFTMPLAITTGGKDTVVPAESRTSTSQVSAV